MSKVKSESVRKQYGKDLQKVRRCLVEVITEIEDIRYRVNPCISAEYAARIGCLQNEEAQARYYLAKARYDLGFGERPEEGIVAACSESSLSEWEDALQKKMRIANQAMAKAQNLMSLSSEDAAKMKLCLRRLVALAHPDLHSESDVCESIFSLVRKAYVEADVGFLFALEKVARGLVPEEPFGLDENSLQIDLELANAQMSFFSDVLEEIREDAPYILGDLLKDQDWLDGQVALIRGRINQVNIQRAVLEEGVIQARKR